MHTSKTIVLAASVGLSVLFAGTAARAVEIEYWQYIFDARITAMDKLIAN